MMPTRASESSITGKPEKPCWDLTALNSPMVLSGEMIDASEALGAGLVSEVAPHEVSIERALKLAQTIATKPPVSVRLAKEAVLKSYDLTLEAGLDFVADACPGAELWAAGFSLGAWIALTAGVTDPRVTRLLAIAPPVGRRDFEGVRASGKPMCFIHGTEDELIPIALLREFYEQVNPPKTLTVINGANHLFDGWVPAVGTAIERGFGEEQS